MTALALFYHRLLHYFKEHTCSLSNKALLGAIGVVVSSAEDLRVTVALVIAPDDIFTAYPVGVKVKVSSCRVLSHEEQNAIPRSKIAEALSRCLSSHISTASALTLTITRILLLPQLPTPKE